MYASRIHVSRDSQGILDKLRQVRRASVPLSRQHRHADASRRHRDDQGVIDVVGDGGGSAEKTIAHHRCGGLCDVPIPLPRAQMIGRES